MSHSDLERLRGIKTFPSLIKYLRDELEWPIESADEDDLIFDYTAEELGLDPRIAAKVEEIKQLRPFAVNQPWGIFFVKFEPKHLPVVVLRRVLQALVVKRRAQAGRAHKASWRLNDLLFISSYGDSGERAISFAHFCEPPEERKGDLPTLHVLGWDGGDTVLHLDHVHKMLKEKLKWRDGFETDPDGWRETWSEPFTIRHREVVSTSKDLALKLADLAKGIRKRAAKILEVETDAGPLRKLHKAFQESLIHDLSRDDFADMYAQTIAYGLLAARVTRQAGITADDLHAAVPITNPFLKEMLEAFLTEGGRRGKIDFDELGVQEVVELLNSPKTNMDAVLRDFGNMNPQEDPVIHFYELFLKEYDKHKKASRGVFYTPKPVVSYIVRSVHELLQKEFGLEDGLADTTTWGEMARLHKDLKIPEEVNPDQAFVQILDPATGTATFLVFVIDVIYQTMMEKWAREGKKGRQLTDAWNDYVPKHLLPRLFGYELMMAPYAIAHMKIGLKLLETGYRFGSKERVNVYLTNALEPPSDKQLRTSSLPALAHEAAAVNDIKRSKRFTVVIGNPPYSNFGQLNRIPFILDLLEDYKCGLDEKKINIDDDFIKFIRFSQYLLDNTGVGVSGMITNNTFIDGVTHWQMRKCLLETFNDIYVLNLHGNLRKRENVPGGGRDENAFDIQQGVAIGLFIALPGKSGCSVFHADLWGERESKYRAIIETSEAKMIWQKVKPVSPFHFFIPVDSYLQEEYQGLLSIKDMLVARSEGIMTSRDEFIICFEMEDLVERLQQFRDLSKTDHEIAAKFWIADTRDWSLSHARKQLASDKNWKQGITKILTTPFDQRFTHYSKTMLDWPRIELMQNLLNKPNIALLTTRQTKDDFGVLAANLVARHKSASRYDKTFVFPLYIYPDSLGQRDLLSSNERVSNFAPGSLKALAGALHVPQSSAHGLPAGLTPEDIFNYIYAVFHSPGYRGRYAEFLKIDFPRLPLTESLELFRALVRLGADLVALHLLESPKVERFITECIGGCAPEVEKISWTNNTVWVDKAQTAGFKGVREDVWNFHIGGYQVCEKWLKDRKGRKLSKADIDHYQKIVVALSETIRLMAEIDKVIDKHGGWPGAFVAKHNEGG